MTSRLQTPILALGLALACGIIIGLVMRGDAGVPAVSMPPPAIDPAVPEAAGAGENYATPERAATGIDATSRLLQDEIRERQALARKLEALERQIAALESAGPAAPAAASPAQQPVDDMANSTLADAGWFDQQALLDGGMDSGLANELKLFFEQMEMDRLYLRDRAAREDWDSEQRRSQMQALESREEALRDRLGESGYDAYLYASGRANRVAVTSVLASAQAGQAGIRSGDHIMRYNNQRIYDWRDLRAATTRGAIGDTVLVEVERDGETLQFYLARGPLGIRMNSIRVAP